MSLLIAMVYSNRSLSYSRRIFRKTDFWALLVASSSVGITLGCSGTTVTNNAPPESGGGGVSVGGNNSTGGVAVVTGGSPSVNPTGGSPGAGGGAPTGGAPPNATGGIGPAPTGGAVATGGKPANTGGVGAGGGNPQATGGTPNTATGGIGPTETGGAAAGGSTGKGTGGAAAGGPAATGGKATGTGGAAAGAAATGGKAATGGSSAAAATGGAPAGGGGSVSGPCDIYEAASTPCAAAYSVTRRLYSKYTGPLYSVRKGGSAGTGGTVTEIGTTSDGFADGAAHDTACGTSGCTFAVLHDQSGKGNDLKVAPGGCYSGTAGQQDYESNALKKSITISGHKVYELYMGSQEGYRNDSPTGAPSGSASQGVYELADGTHFGTACCFDFGIASKNNCYGATGSMNAIYFGTGYWGKGTGNGPWFMGDFEAGVWATGSGASTAVNSSLPSSTEPYAFGILKTTSNTYDISVGNGASGGGTLTVAYNGAAPATFATPGGIILGIGGDNSNSSQGTFYEGAVTTGRPSDTTDAAILANVQAAKYGQ